MSIRFIYIIFFAMVYAWPHCVSATDAPSHKDMQRITDQARQTAWDLYEIMKNGDIRAFINMHHERINDDPYYEENNAPITTGYLYSMMGPADVYVVRDFFLKHQSVDVFLSEIKTYPDFFSLEVTFYDPQMHQPASPTYKFWEIDDSGESSESTQLFFVDGKWGLAGYAFYYEDRHWPD